ncbi:alpha/beta fold hydrolase [Ectothiorhodospiraceae bacterium 2226]|nr:alpha/beta fold hydrolase [Ectothiorhodospiraceae bacterium 2226]
MLIFYLHGFSSTSQSRKGQALKRLLPEHRVVCLDYPYPPFEAARALVHQASEHGAGHQPCVFIGASLGGLFARYLATRFAAKAVLINPVVRAELMRALIGPVENYYTGEHYEWRAEDVEELKRYDAPLTFPTLVLLDEADEVLDYRMAVAAYRDAAEVIVFPGGDHAFQHLDDSIPHIRQFLFDSTCNR